MATSAATDFEDRFVAAVWSRPAPQRRARIVDVATIGGLALLGLFQSLSYSRLDAVGPDSSVYLVLAENLSAGEGYVFNGKPHAVYPPGFPLLLAAVGTVFGDVSYGSLVRFMPVLGAAGLGCWYFALRGLAGPWPAAAACLLTATTSPWFDLNTRQVLSESAFLTFSGAALLCLTTLSARPRKALPDALLVAGTVVFTVAAIMTRTVGVALGAGLAGWAIYCVARNRTLRLPQTAALLAAVACGATFLSWMTWTARTQALNRDTSHMATYGRQFTMKDPHRPDLGRATPVDLARRARANLIVQGARIAELLTRVPYVAPLWHAPLVVLPLALLVVGGFAALRDPDGSAVAWYFAAYFGVYLLWPFDEGVRFMLPVAPIAFVLLWRGILAVRAAINDARPAWLFAAALASLALGVAALPSWSTMGIQGKASIVAWFVLAAILALWPAWRTVLHDWHWETRTLVARTATIGLLLLLATGFYQQCQAARENLAGRPGHYRHLGAEHFGAWLRRQPPGAVMAGQWAIIHRISRRPIVGFPITGNVDTIVDALRRDDIRWLLVCDSERDAYFFPTEAQRRELIDRAQPRLLRAVYRGPSYRVFEVTSQGIASK